MKQLLVGDPNTVRCDSDAFVPLDIGPGKVVAAPTPGTAMNAAKISSVERVK